MRTIPSRIAIALLGVLLASTIRAASPEALAPGEARYLVTLTAGAHPPDLVALGGRMEGRDGSALTVVLPVRAATTLAVDPAVESIREVPSGTPRGTPENVAAHRPAANALRLTPLANVTLWGAGQYVYDGAGHITAIGTAGAPNSDGKTSMFTYDVGSRLTEASIGRVTGLGDIRESYRYDGFGNLKTHQRTGLDSRSEERR